MTNASVITSPDRDGSQMRCERPSSKLGLLQALIVAAIFSAIICLFQLALPLFSMQIFDRVLPADSLPTLVTLSLLMVGLLASSTVVDASRAMILTRVAGRVAEAPYRRASNGAVSGNHEALLITKDIELIRHFVAGPVASALLDAPWSLAFLLAMFLLHPALGWFAVLAMMVMLTAGFSAHLVTTKYRARAARLYGEGANVLNDALHVGDAIAAMGMQERLLDKLAHIRGISNQSGKVANERQAWIDATSRGLRNLIQVGVLALAASLVLSSGLNTGAIVASSMLLSRILGPVERASASAPTLAGVFFAYRRISAFSKTCPETRTYMELSPLEGLVVADNVSLFSPQRSSNMLRNISLTIKPGETLVIVGREGAGKSSLARLLAGAVRATNGVVRIDGTDITHFRPSSLGSQIGFTSESTDFRVGVVSRFLARDSDPDPVEVIRVSRLFNLHGVIQRLPLGYQTEIGEKSSIISAGERRRLALARAFYGRPRLVVLDEPTTHLDDNGETTLLSALQEAKQAGCTLVVVSRLPGLLHLADQLVMLDNGTIALTAGQREMQQFLAPRLATSKG